MTQLPDGDYPIVDPTPAFRRYTDILSVIDMLMNQRITLLPPSRWVDENDRTAMERYATAFGAPGAVAFCLTGVVETFHHWQVFAGPKLGACVVFNRAALLRTFDRHSPRIIHGPVRYMDWKDMSRQQHLHPEEYAFLKRKVFQDEREYRAVALSDPLGSPYLNVPIEPATAIRRIVLGPDIPDQLMYTLEALIRSFDGCADTSIHFSRMPDNQRWREAFDALTLPPNDDGHAVPAPILE